MEIFSIIISSVIILLLIALVATIIKYPRDIFIELPAGILKMGAERLWFYISLITIPIWLPVFFLDHHFKWGIFNHRFFKFFNSKRNLSDNLESLPDLEYKENQRIHLPFSEYSKYLISSLDDVEKLIKCLRNGLESIGKETHDFKPLRIGNVALVQYDKIELYEFHYLIQWMDNELPKSRNYGFAMNSDFSFFGITDKKSLNNIVGKTSRGDVYAFNLVSGQEDYLSLIDKVHFKSKYSTKFFEKLINKPGENS